MKNLFVKYNLLLDSCDFNEKAFSMSKNKNKYHYLIRLVRVCNWKKFNEIIPDEQSLYLRKRAVNK